MVVKQKHFNVPQIRSRMIDSPIEIVVIGRGGGKTVVVLAGKAIRYWDSMPRGNHIVLAATYTQAFGTTLPELIRGLQSFGYHYDKHFIVGKRPPAKWVKTWKWKGPYAYPEDFKNTICWWNGAVAQLVSQANSNNQRGRSIDSIIGDEFKLINREKFQTELIPANRGFIPEFEGNIYHHGMTFTTDMPVGTAGRWILDYREKMDQNQINEIWKLLSVRYEIVTEIKQQPDKKLLQELLRDLEIIEEELTKARKGCLYYHESSTLANIDALGLDYIKEQLRNSTQFQFDTQILNIRPLRLEDGFYPDFDEEKHGYFAENKTYFERFDYDPYSNIFDCSKDDILGGGDLDLDAPLHIGMDNNKRITPIAVGQVNRKRAGQRGRIRTIKGIHVLYPLKLKDAVQKFCDYYKPHRKKLVYFWFDQTFTSEQHETRMCDDVIEILRKNGWVVIEMYLGPQPTHEQRYRMWGDLCTDSDKYDYSYGINRQNCDKLILAKLQAQTEERKDGYGKDKRSEKDTNFPAEESIHYTDAEDTYVFGILESGMDFSSDSSGGSSIIFK